MKNFDCITAYAHFRKLPYTLSIASLILNFICSIIAVNMKIAIGSTAITLYAALGFSRFGFLALYWVCSLIFGIIVCYLTAVIISPTIIRTTIAAEGAVYGFHLAEENDSKEESKTETDTMVICPSCKCKLSFTKRYIPNGRMVMCLRCGERFAYQHNEQTDEVTE